MPKGLLAALVSAPKAKTSEEGESPESEMGDSLQMSAEEVMSAVKDGDAAALATALKSFVSMCSHEE